MGYIGAGPTRFNTADDLTVTGDAEFNGNLTVKGTTTTIDSASVQTIDLGDNDKIRLGDSDDLQIFHDGSNSWINEVGTGQLILAGEDVRITTPNAGEFMATFGVNGAATLYYDNAAKLATTATGVDVTGTVTADGLAVIAASGDTPVSVQTATGGSFIQISDTNTTAGRSPLVGTITDDLVFYTNNGSYAERLRIDSSGNVGIGTSSPASKLHVNGSFRQTGATAPFEWTVNAGATDYYKLNSVGYSDNIIVATAAGKVGIGTASPLAKLHTYGADALMRLDDTNGGVSFIGHDATGAYWRTFTSDTHRFLRASGTESMRIDSSGRVGIGTTNPASEGLDITKAGGANFVAQFTNTTSATPYGVWIKEPASAANGYPSLQVTDNAGTGTRFRVDSGTGYVTMPYQPSFAATRSQGNVTNGVYVFPNVYHNIGNHYNSSNGRFTAPVTGSYFISNNIMNENNFTYNNYTYEVRVNGSLFQYVYSSSGSNVHHRWNWSGVMYLQAGDYVEIYVPSGFYLYGSASQYTHFSGYLLG